MDQIEFASTVLEALSQPTDDVPASDFNEDSMRNAAACMTTVLCNRLSKTGQIAELVGRTTFQWNQGVVNFRNAVGNDLWTNLRTTFTDQMHSEATSHPVAYVMAAWLPSESTMHVWTIPENIVYDALPNHALSKRGEKRTVKIFPAKHRFERCDDSPNLEPHYRLLQLSANETSQLTDAAKVDQLVHEKKPSESATATLSSAFAQFHTNPVDQTRVYVRRKRAEQLRSSLANVETIDLDSFNHDVWVFESSTRLAGDEIKGQLFPDQDLAPDSCELIRAALDSDTLEMHGNYIWGSGTQVYGPQLRGVSDDEKLEHVRTALRILNDPQLPPIEKAKQIREVPGFGFNMATGLVMVKHPDEFAIWNKQSKEAFKKLGYNASDLSSFQASIRTLREELGAEDFLELDWFLYQINQGTIPIGDPVPHPTDLTPQPSGNCRYWAISLGEGGRLWPQCRAEGIIAIGWDWLGDLRQYKTREECAEALKKHRDDDSYPINDSLACFQFTNELAIGDYVFAKRGMANLYGFGIIESEYEYDPNRAEYRSLRKVKWLTDGHWEIPDNTRVPLKTLTDVSEYQPFLKFAIPLMEEEQKKKNGGQKENGGGQLDIYTIDQAVTDLFISEEHFKDILTSLARKKNVILQGPPGTGKTFISKRLAYALVGFKEVSKVAMVQFHQSYAYEDFIQGWRPEEGGGFQLRNGVFYEFCKKASGDEKSTYVFIIDEINRGNLSKIFGELLMLIEADKRGESFAIPLTYSRDLSDTFQIPSNLHIIGMMNTADRSLAMVDYALRRRFTFVDLRPAFSSEDFRSYLEENEVESNVIETVIARMLKLNEEIRAEKTNLGPGFEIGHSFFCPQGTEDELGMDWYRSIIRAEIAPLLREYWFDDLEKAESMISQLVE